MKWLLRGFPGHPLHPPLTDATIGAYTFATAMVVLSRLGVSEHNTATAWWLALIAGLILTAPTAITGFVEWLEIPRGTPLWRTATAHLTAMLSATVLFAIAAGSGHADYVDGVVSGGALVLTLAGYVVLARGRLARRGDRVRPRHARAQPRGRADGARGLSGPEPGEGGSGEAPRR